MAEAAKSEHPPTSSASMAIWGGEPVVDGLRVTVRHAAVLRSTGAAKRSWRSRASRFVSLRNGLLVLSPVRLLGVWFHGESIMPQPAGPDHDQRLKVLLKEFFEAFFQCFFPAWAPRFEFVEVDWLDKELFLAPPQG